MNVATPCPMPSPLLVQSEPEENGVARVLRRALEEAGHREDCPATVTESDDACNCWVAEALAMLRPH